MEIEPPQNYFYQTLFLQNYHLELPTVKVRIDEWVSHQIQIGTDYMVIWKKIDQISFELDQTQPLLSWSLLSTEGLDFKQLFYQRLSKLPNKKQYLEIQLNQFWNKYQTYEKFIEFVEFTQDLDFYDEFREMLFKFLQSSIQNIIDIDQLWQVYDHIIKISKIMTIWDGIKPELLKRTDLIIHNTKLDYENKEHLDKFYQINKFTKSNRFYKLLHDHFQSNFNKIINDKSNPDIIMVNFTQYAQSLTDFWKQFYPDDNKWLDQIGISYSHFVNQEPLEMTKMFIELINVSLQQANQEQAQYILRVCKDQIKYFHYREIFENFYTQKLLERIFYRQSQSIEIELNYINEIQDQLSDTFTKRAQELIQNYKEKQQYYFEDFTVELVLMKKELWPYQETQDCNFLKEAQIQIYQNCYEKFQRKKWETQLKLSTVLIQGFKQYDFEVSVPIAKLLLLFNDSRRLSIQLIIDQLKIDENQLIQLISTLQSINLINRVDMHIDVNLNFYSQHKLIKLNTIQKTEETKNQDEMKEIVEGRQFLNDKKYILESVIVKILKQEKELLFKILVAQIYQIIKIQLALEDVKFQVEQLISKGYLSRSSLNPHLISYLP